MVVLVTGASGMIGSRLVPELARAGHTVARAVRRPPSSHDEVQWNPATGMLEPLRSFDAVVHLAGRNLAEARWTAGEKRRIWSSRVDPTRALSERLAAAFDPPRVMITASGIGIYGDRGDETLDETSALGQGFLAELARAWEGAMEPLTGVGCRTMSLRLGLVLAREGGGLPPMLIPARMGLGGRLGSGRQYWSWVAIGDVVAVILHVLGRPSLTGPLNVVTPHPIRQAEFARILGRVLRRPAFMPVPAWALRWVLGELADSQVLSSTRALPRRLESDGFSFMHPELEGALRATLVRPVDEARRRPLGSAP